MFSFSRRLARVAFALSVVIVPLEVRFFGRGIGWGVTFPFGLYVAAPGIIEGTGSQFRFPHTELGLLGQYGEWGQVAMVAWIAAAIVIVVTSAFVVLLEHDRAWTRNRLAIAGAAYLAAGLTFLVSRVPLYETVFVSSREMPNWFTVPAGAVYVALVGAIYVHWARVSVTDQGQNAGID